MKADSTRTVLAEQLEKLYVQYNRREAVHPDPIEFLYDHDDLRDREVVALIASALAYGKVAQIMKSVAGVLERMPSPADFLSDASERTLRRTFADFRHRFAGGKELAAFLSGIKHALNQYGSLQACFKARLSRDDETVLPALSAFVRELTFLSGGRPGHLLPSPTKGSACKRLNLFLRWMVRRDKVDPGGWKGISRSKLIVPLDTHMYRIARILGITVRRQANMRTALEVTAAFREVAPVDPVRYDFALSHLGMRNHPDLDAFLEKCSLPEEIANA